MQHAPATGRRELRYCDQRELAQRAQRIGGDVVAYQIEVSADDARAGCAMLRRASSARFSPNELPPEMQRRMRPRTARCDSRRRLRAGRSRFPRRSPGRTPDRSCRSRRAARGGCRSKSPRRSADRDKSEPPPAPARATIGSVSRVAGHGLSSQKRGSEQISALFENGVIVPIVGSDARTARQRVQPAASDDRVGIEQHDVGVGTRALDAAVGGQREAEVGARWRATSDCGRRARLRFARNTRDRRVGATHRRSASSR